MSILKDLSTRSKQGKKSIAVLVDPDKINELSKLDSLLRLAAENCVDYFFVGGSLVSTTNLSAIIKYIKRHVTLPVVLFPGSALQIDPSADAILFLSLISGRNPDLLIGQHVIAAPIIKSNNLEVLPTGYMLINSGKTTSVAYISNTTPIPEDKYSLAACTAMAGEMLGLQLIYLDAGSGAEREVSSKMINSVRKSVSVPLIVGGGINSAEKATRALQAGADLIVIGNALEKEPDLLIEISDSVYEWNQSIAS
ncbi:MAG: geranylgeranylglyceryl/heptaprenylglyceryl phosphate synthase [Bacteroidetes bacterium]|nr:geranylgeranylglyceryl/heptaprenylglyceryl phosphate synthase [Bacteroidota bacterium]MBS1539121.1 geranylgeranylglyceryl/heptaprenylglyceryl phosphate synthase [Bacteroidota bacterium]